MALAGEFNTTMEDVQAVMRRIIRQGGDLRKPLARCMTIGLRSVDLNFQQGGRPFPWEPVVRVGVKESDDGREWDEVTDVELAGFELEDGDDGPTGQVLMKTGVLRGSVQPNNPYSLSEIGPDELRIGTSIPWAWVHNEGYEGGADIKPKEAKALRFPTADGFAFSKGHKQGAIPQRQFLGWQPEDLDAFQEEFMAHLLSTKRSYAGRDSKGRFISQGGA